MAEVNDVVLMRNPDWECLEYYVRRKVVAVTEGRAVVEHRSEYRIEPKPGNWPVMGRLIPVRRWLFWTGWQFIPNEK